MQGVSDDTPSSVTANIGKQKTASLIATEVRSTSPETKVQERAAVVTVRSAAADCRNHRRSPLAGHLLLLVLLLWEMRPSMLNLILSGSQLFLALVVVVARLLVLKSISLIDARQEAGTVAKRTELTEAGEEGQLKTCRKLGNKTPRKLTIFL